MFAIAVDTNILLNENASKSDFNLTDSNKIEIAQQDGSRDCGLFAIAVATDIQLNENASSFCQQMMRNHLLQRFEANNYID